MPRILIFTALLLSIACAGTAPMYGPGDPLGQGRPPITLYRHAASSDTPRVPLLRAVVGEGFTQMEGWLNPPVIAMFTKKIYEGEAALLVERYSASDGNAIDSKTFLKHLGADNAESAPSVHAIGEKKFSVYHGLEYTRFTERIPAGDPYASYLGSHLPPPKLSMTEKRRFLKGGEAYRLYRCRRLNAWGILADYQRARKDKKAITQFRTEEFGPTERRIIAACFGRSVIMAFGRGEPVSDIPKPSMYRLKILAREEHAHGAIKAVERECLHLKEIPGGFLILRFRAPRQRFQEEHASFDAFLNSFTYF